jgi:RNA polymerase sigma-70 factor (ECF subfamily)
MATDDADILEQVAAGDLSAFRIIVERYQASLLNYIARYTGDRAAAEDICQEAFLRVYKSAAEYRPLSSFKTWLFTIATNLCLNDLRDNRVFRHSVDIFELNEAGFVALPSLSPSPEKETESREMSAILMKALKGLPEKQRVALLLHKYEGFSYLDISRIMDCTVPAVESLIHRARLGLRKELTPYL